MNEELLTMLKALAEQECASDNDDFSAFDYSGGNFDDAFSIGFSDGQVSLAREILERVVKSVPKVSHAHTNQDPIATK